MSSNIASGLHTCLLTLREYSRRWSKRQSNIGAMLLQYLMLYGKALRNIATVLKNQTYSHNKMKIKWKYLWGIVQSWGSITTTLQKPNENPKKKYTISRMKTNYCSTIFQYIPVSIILYRNIKFQVFYYYSTYVNGFWEFSFYLTILIYKLSFSRSSF